MRDEGGRHGAAAQLPPPKFSNVHEATAYKLHEEGKKLEDRLLEGRPTIWRQLDAAHASSLQLLRLDGQLQGLKAERDYLERHGQLPPPGTPLYPNAAA